MKQPVYLVSGATGRTGAAVVTQLREKNANVRAMVHREDKRSAHLHSLGAEVVVADMFNPLDVQTAMRGASRVYFCPPMHPHMLHSAVAFATAARRSEVEAIVGLSQWLASPWHPALLTRQHWLVDQLFAMVPDILTVTVNPGFFAESYLGFGLTGMAAQLGILPLPMGEAKNAPPANEDIARVVVGALMDPERHAGRIYRPTGPRLLSGAEIAATLGEALGRKVRHIDAPVKMFRKAARTMGIDPYTQVLVAHYLEENRRGTFAIGAPTTHVYDVSGVEPEPFLVTARRYAALPEAQRTPRNLLHALWNAVRMPLVPGLDAADFARRQQQPYVAAPELSADSQLWVREHCDTPAALVRSQ